MQKFFATSTVIIETYAASVLRYAMSAVILWFSIQQFLHNSSWTAYIPDSIVSMTHLGAPVLVFLNACFELVFGMALVIGWQTRIVALLLSLHLFDIMWVVGYGEIGVRDFGLAWGTFVIFMNGPDLLCLRPKKAGLGRLTLYEEQEEERSGIVMPTQRMNVSPHPIDQIRPPRRLV